MFAFLKKRNKEKLVTRDVEHMGGKKKAVTVQINLKVCALVCKLKFTHKSVEKKCIGTGRGQIKFKNRSRSINLTRITTSACFNAIVYRCGFFIC